MSGITFESLETNLETLFGRVLLVNWFSRIFKIFCLPISWQSFVSYKFATYFNFVADCELFQPIFTRLLIVSARFYVFTSRFY